MRITYFEPFIIVFFSIFSSKIYYMDEETDVEVKRDIRRKTIAYFSLPLNMLLISFLFSLNLTSCHW